MRATYDVFVTVPGVFAEPDLAVLALAYLPANPVLVYHPDLTLTNGVHLVGDANWTGVLGRIFRASHRSCLRGMGFEKETGLVMYKGEEEGGLMR